MHFYKGAPAQVSLASCCTVRVIEAEVPADGRHEDAGRDIGVPRKVGAHVDRDLRRVGLRAAVGEAAKAAKRLDLPR